MFTKYSNGAEVEMTEVARYEAGAEVAADGVYAVKSGAEEQMWGGSVLGTYSFFSEGERQYETQMNADLSTLYTFQKGTEAYLRIMTDEGEFLNPTIRYTYFGGASTGSGYDIAGTLYVIGIDATGRETKNMVTNFGSSTDFTGGNIEQTLSGTFKQVGIQVYLRDSSNKSNSYYAELEISNFTIDGRKYIAN